MSNKDPSAVYMQTITPSTTAAQVEKNLEEVRSYYNRQAAMQNAAMQGAISAGAISAGVVSTNTGTWREYNPIDNFKDAPPPVWDARITIAKAENGLTMFINDRTTLRAKTSQYIAKDEQELKELLYAAIVAARLER